MKTLRFPLLALLFGATLLTSCDDDKDKTPEPAKTKTELLTGKEWVMTARTRTATNGGAVTDVFANMASTDKDDLYRFDTPDKYTWDEGPTKAANNPQTYIGTWMMKSNETILSTTDQFGANTFDIKELTENSLVLSGVGSTTSGTQYTEVRTYAKK
jgi:hypothetical protein